MAILAQADLWLYAFSVVGLWLVPAVAIRGFQTELPGLVLITFGVVGIALIAAPEMSPALQPARSVAVWFAISQLPWLLVLPDLFSRGRVAQVLDDIPLRALFGWSVFHFMGVRHILSVLRGDLSPTLGLTIASGEFFSGLGALVLWLIYRPQNVRKTWFLIAALFWNAHALFTSLEFSTRLLRAHPGLPFWGKPAPDLFAQFAVWPGSLEALFWTPLAIMLHAGLFYKLLSPRSNSASNGFNPGSTP